MTANVTPNSENRTFFENDVMPYIEYIKLCFLILAVILTKPRFNFGTFEKSTIPGMDDVLNAEKISAILNQLAISRDDFIELDKKFNAELKPEDTATSSDFSHKEDTEIIQCLNDLTNAVTKHLENYQLHLAVEKLYDFIWHKFADSYIELSKKRRAEAQPCLEHVFKTCLELLHPFMPYITEELWQKLPHEGKSIMISKWPSVGSK